MSLFSTAILAAEGISTKVEKFKALSGFGPDEKKLLWNTFNPYRVFNVRKYDQPVVFASVDLSYDIFFTLLDQLNDRIITGNAARDAVTAVLGSYTEDTANILARVLNKDLKCGAGRDSFEVLYDDLDIPKFELMLAGKIEEAAVATKHNPNILTEEILRDKYGMTFPLQAEAKYDGRRLLCMVENGIVTPLSRSGNEYPAFKGVFDDELIELEKTVGQPFVIDGEVLNDKGFQATSTGVDSDKSGLKFYAFDVMTLEQWKTRDNKYHQGTRSKYLSTLLDKHDFKKVTRSKWKVCYSVAELIAFYNEVLEDGREDDGSLNGRGEGLIIKRLDGLYVWARSEVIRSGRGKTTVIVQGHAWCKWKPILDLDLKIVGFEYGKGRLAKTVGKLLLEGYDENGTFIKAKCGSGLNDKMRAEMIKDFSKFMGKTAMIECQEISLPSGGTVHSARFPIFCKIRNDK